MGGEESEWVGANLAAGLRSFGVLFHLFSRKKTSGVTLLCNLCRVTEVPAEIKALLPRTGFVRFQGKGGRQRARSSEAQKRRQVL